MLLVATSNRGKLREFRTLLPDIDLLTPDQIDLDLQVEETGSTFAANARLKARAHAAASGLVSIADDSGLEVDALDGDPGVFSARYGGEELDDRGRCRLLLERLAEAVSQHGRAARFRCVLVAAAPDGRECWAEGTCEGLIHSRLAGEGGFGYDPVFFVPDLGRTMAQIPVAVKNRISHRSQAIRAIRPALASTFAELLP